MPAQTTVRNVLEYLVDSNFNCITVNRSNFLITLNVCIWHTWSSCVYVESEKLLNYHSKRMVCFCGKTKRNMFIMKILGIHSIKYLVFLKVYAFEWCEMQTTMNPWNLHPWNCRKLFGNGWRYFRSYSFILLENCNH